MEINTKEIGSMIWKMGMEHIHIGELLPDTLIGGLWDNLIFSAVWTQFTKAHGPRAKRKELENLFICRVESCNMDATKTETGRHQKQKCWRRRAYEQFCRRNLSTMYYFHKYNSPIKRLKKWLSMVNEFFQCSKRQHNASSAVPKI